MIYYSTGKSPHLPSRGKTVETNNVSVVNELLKSGSIVENEAELNVTSEKSDVEVKINTNTHFNDGSKIVEPKPKAKGNTNWKKK